MKNPKSKFDHVRSITDVAEELDLLGPSNADCVTPHLPERITISLRNTAADIDVIIEHVHPNGLVVRQCINEGSR